ncbi:hypothetical protein Tco_0852584 [Tanacetum coccineum]
MQTTESLKPPAHKEFEQAWNKSVPAIHESVQPWLSNLAQRQDPRESFDELTDTTFDFSAFVMNRLNVQTLTPELLAVYKATTEKLDWINPEGRQYPHDLRQPLPLVPNSQDYGHIKWIEDLVPNSMWSQMIVKYEKFSLWGISHWGKTKDSSMHLRPQGNQLVTSTQKEELLLSQRVAFNVSLRMFTRSVVIQRHVEDLQLGVESYQKKLNLTKPDTYRSNLRRRDAYTPYFDPRGFIYGNKDKKNRLMRIDELHKFSDGTLDDVRTALNDRLKGIRMEYLPQTFWSQRDKVNARVMIQAIDKSLKTRRIMRSLERFVGGRPYGGDLRLLQRTI